MRTLSIQKNKVEFIKGVHSPLKIAGDGLECSLFGLEDYLLAKQISSLEVDSLKTPKLNILTNLPDSLSSL